MNTMRIVVILEARPLSRQIGRLPEQNTIEIVSTNGPHHPLNERLRNADIRNGQYSRTTAHQRILFDRSFTRSIKACLSGSHPSQTCAAKPAKPIQDAGVGAVVRSRVDQCALAPAGLLKRLAAISAPNRRLGRQPDRHGLTNALARSYRTLQCK